MAGGYLMPHKNYLVLHFWWSSEPNSRVQVWNTSLVLWILTAPFWDKLSAPVGLIMYLCFLRSISVKANKQVSSPPWSVQIEPPRLWPQRSRNVSTMSSGGSLVLVRNTHVYCELSWKCQHFRCEDMSLCRPDLSAWHGRHVANIETFDGFFCVICCVVLLIADILAM